MIQSHDIFLYSHSIIFIVRLNINWEHIYRDEVAIWMRVFLNHPTTKFKVHIVHTQKFVFEHIDTDIYRFHVYIETFIYA